MNLTHAQAFGISRKKGSTLKTSHHRYETNSNVKSRLISSGSQFTVNDISYDPQGNIETLTRNAPTMANPEGTPVDQLSYNYTARTNRLASVADAVSTDLDWDAKPSTFQYNRMGSMTQMAETLSSTSFREIEVQHYDCLPRSSGERQLPEELQIRLFVAPGGMVEATQVSYHYDVNGQRIGKHVRPAPVIGDDPPRSGSIVQERYVRDGMRLIGVFDENNELKSWNIGGVAGLVGRAIPDPRAFQPVPLYYMTDHLGSIRAVVNASGTVTEGRDYYPYGLTMPGRFYVQADTTHEGFTGYEQDKETGFYYAGARFYNPALGRFLTTDRFQELYPGLSTYQYAGGNPVSIIDVNGDTLFVRGDQEAIGGFVQVANASMGGHHLVSVGADGMVNVTDTGIDGSMTEQQQAFYDALMGAASLDVGAVNIDLVENSPYIDVGSYMLSAIDMVDVLAMGHGPVSSSAAALGHEIVEQASLQLHAPHVYNTFAVTRESFRSTGVPSSPSDLERFAHSVHYNPDHQRGMRAENRILGVSSRSQVGSVEIVRLTNGLVGIGIFYRQGNTLSISQKYLGAGK